MTSAVPLGNTVEAAGKKRAEVYLRGRPDFRLSRIAQPSIR